MCKRYEVDNASRTLHGALLDAEILADVYLAMTGGQADLGLSMEHLVDAGESSNDLDAHRQISLKVLRASEDANHAVWWVTFTHLTVTKSY